MTEAGNIPDPPDAPWRMGTREFIAVLATIMALTALAIDLMLPTFADVREHFDLPSDSSATARIVTFFFLGFAGQILFGPLSDRYGRLPVMRAGFALYGVGAVAATFAPNLDAMLLARLVWGAGAGAMQVSALAMIRDRFEGDEMARVLSFVLMVFLIIPVIAPVLGRVVLTFAPWRVVFAIPLFVAVLLFGWSLRLVESLPPANRLPELRAQAIFASMRVVFGNRTTMRYVAAQTASFAAFSSYLASSERIIGEIYDREEWFVPIFVTVSLTMVALSAINAAVVHTIGARRAALAISSALVVISGGTVAAALATSGLPRFALFVVPFVLMIGLNGMVEPNFSAMALEPQGDRAGLAAAIYGSSYIAIGAALGAVVDGLISATVTPLVLAVLVSGTIGVVLLASDRDSVLDGN